MQSHHDKHLDLRLLDLGDRQQYVCDNGCGVCEIKEVQVDHATTESVGGVVLERRWHREPVSKCCAATVWIYDEGLGLIDAYVRIDQEKPAQADGES